MISIQNYRFLKIFNNIVEKHSGKREELDVSCRCQWEFSFEPHHSVSTLPMSKIILFFKCSCLAALEPIYFPQAMHLVILFMSEFRDESTIIEKFHRKFRVVSGSGYLTKFSSDRRHMRKEDEGRSWLSPPPTWPCIKGDQVNKFAHASNAKYGVDK